MEASDPASQQIVTKHQTVESELQSATHFGDTVLHLLVTKGHNELALKVFQKDMSLLKAQNKMLETPLHCAAKVGNEEVIQDLIRHNSNFIKVVLRETDDNGDTALHVAAKHDNIDVGRVLMNLDREVAYKLNKEKLSPLYVAIIKGYSNMVKVMLQEDATLACIQDSNGMFPVHVAARMGYAKLVKHFMEIYPNYVELQDPCGRNLFHIAAENNQTRFFEKVLKDKRFGEKIARMNKATDYEGNTPLHMAAMKKHKEIMSAIFQNKMHEVAETIRNKQGFTPLELFMSKVTAEDIMKPSRTILNIAEKTQVIGLGSVLITTVAFAAAFTFPGGYNQDNGTPVLGRKYMFRAYLLANAWAFVEAFLSLLFLIVNSLLFPNDAMVATAAAFFIGAASSMVVTFGIGSYLMLAPVSMPIAIIILVLSMFSWSLTWLYGFTKKLLGALYSLNRYNSYSIYALLTCLALSVWLAFFFALAK